MSARVSWAVGSDTEPILDTIDARYALGGLLTPAGLVTSRGGWRPSGAGDPGKVTATSPTPDGRVHVAPFQYYLPSERDGTVYTLTLDAVEDIDILGAHPADPANTRHDLIVAQQSDARHGDADSLLRIRRVPGIPSAAPQDPDPTDGGALSPDYVVLARVRVQPGATAITPADIDDLRPPALTVGLGGILPVTGLAERAEITSPYPGMTVWRGDRRWHETWDGTGWRVVGIPVASSLADLDAAVTHPYPGQTALVTGDGLWYRWTGSAWLAIAPAGATSDTTRHRVRYRQTTPQAFPAGVETPVRFDTAQYSSPDVTVTTAGPGTDFILNRGGHWRIGGCLRVTAGNNDSERYLTLINPADPDNRYDEVNVSSNTASNPLSIALRVGTDIDVPAGTRIQMVFYNGDNITLNSYLVYNSTHFYATWMGP